MAITTSGTIQFRTSSNQFILDNQSSCSIAFRGRSELTGAVLNQNQPVIGRAGNATFECTNTPTLLTGTSPTATISPWYRNSTSYVSKPYTVSVGVPYLYVVTYAQGVQTFWINGQPNALGTLTGNTQSVSAYFYFGDNAFTLEDIVVWNGYALTQSDIAALLFGAAANTIGGSATWYGEWPLTGTAGNTPAIGDAGLKCYSASGVEQATYDFTTTAGTGTAVYAATLSITNSASLNDVHICTSGKKVGFRFLNTATGQLATPTVLGGVPTLYQNGVNAGTLQNPWMTGYHTYLQYQFPTGVVAAPTDTFTVSAPAGWAITNAGIMNSMNGQTVANYTGKSFVGTDTLVKTLRPGLNNSWVEPIYYLSPGWLLKNMRYRISRWSGCTTTGQTIDNQPTQLSGTSASAPINNTDVTTYLDNWCQPGLQGLYAICWDAPTTSHTTFSLGPYGSPAGMTTCTYQADGSNPSGDASGNNRVVLYNVQNITTQFNNTLDFSVILTDSTGVPNFSNLWIVGPDDFTYTPGQTVTIDRSNPYAIGARTLARLANGVGSLRFVDSVLGGGGAAYFWDKSELMDLDYFSYGDQCKGSTYTIPLTQCQPWSQSAHPYVYSSEHWAQPYSATLSVNIPDTTSTTITISDAGNLPTAATGPVLAGQLLTIDSEQMWVTNVSGTSVTVERGANKTTPATHSAQAITVLGRYPITTASFGTDCVAEMVSSSNHNLKSGQSPQWGTIGNMVWADGTSTNWNNGAFGALVTSPTTWIWHFGTSQATKISNNYLTQTYTLSSANATYSCPNGGAFPYEIAAMIAGNFSNCKFHCNFGFCMNDDCIREIARRVRDNFPAGREVWIEMADEPWNWAMGPFVNYLGYVAAIWYPGSMGYEWLVARTLQAKNLFIDVFNSDGHSRGSEIKCLLNMQKSSSTSASNCLNFAATLLGTAMPGAVPGQYGTIDGIAIAPYWSADSSTATINAWWQDDDDQACDLIIADQWYNTSATTQGIAPLSQAMTQAGGPLATYNAATGAKCVLYAYECGINGTVPVSSTTLSTACGASDSTISVASKTGLNVGQYIVVECNSTWHPVANSELMLVTSITGSAAPYTLGVTRGCTNLPLITNPGVAHASGVTIRPCFCERDYDVLFNPNFRQAELDFYALMQSLGYYSIHVYGFLFPGSPENQWTLYYGQGQKPSRGDGLNGAANNRAHLACPGKAGTRSSTNECIFANVDSVRGQAFLDWMSAVACHDGGSDQRSKGRRRGQNANRHDPCDGHRRGYPCRS